MADVGKRAPLARGLEAQETLPQNQWVSLWIEYKRFLALNPSTMDSLTFCSSKGGCFTPVGGQGLSDAESIIPRSTNQIYFLSACESFCVNFWILFDLWKLCSQLSEGSEKAQASKKMFGILLKDLISELWNSWLSLLKDPWIFPFRRFFPHGRRRRSCHGSSHRFGTMEMKIVSGYSKWTKHYFAWLQSLERSWRPRFQMILPTFCWLEKRGPDLKQKETWKATMR